VLHFWWLVKSDIREPLAFAVATGTILGVRLVLALRSRTPTRA